MQHQRKRLTKRFNEQPRRDVGNDHHRNHPPKNQPEKPRENDIRITGDIEKIEIAIYQSLRADDPKAHRSQGEHDGIMNGDSETKRDDIKHNGKRVRHHVQLGQRDTNHRGAEQSVDNAVESELFRETANWLSIGNTRTESSFPMRTSSGMFATFTKKNAWNSCEII